jgi:hypothetical protein
MLLIHSPEQPWKKFRLSVKLAVVNPVTRRSVAVSNWWKAFKPSPPLDFEAGERFKKREGRLLDVVFIGACELAGIPTTSRQARKWNNGAGLALRFRNKAKELL